MLAFVNKDRLIFEFHQGKINDSTDFRIDFGGRIYKWLRVSTQLIEDKSTSDIKAALFYQDIDEQKRKELSIIEKSQLDPLTKVLNREALIKKIEALLSHVRFIQSFFAFNAAPIACFTWFWSPLK